MDFPPDQSPDPQRVKQIEEWIPLDECVDGALYRVVCRHAQWGVFQGEANGFLIARYNPFAVGIPVNGEIHKQENADTIYRFIEDHWDTGAPHGTAKPLKRIEGVWDPSFDHLKKLPDARHGYEPPSKKEVDENE